MPKGVYVRTHQPHLLSGLHRPEVKANASAARKVARPSWRGYKAVGTRKDGPKAVHRLRARAALGHDLPAKAEVHHVDEDTWNENARLVICPDKSYHKLLHYRTRIVRAGGNPDTQKICARCVEIRPRSDFTFCGRQTAFYNLSHLCKSCERKKNAQQRQRALAS